MLAQLGDLQQAGGDAGASAELQNQLAALKSLSQNIATASGAALMQLRGEVAATISASRAAAQQAQTAIVAASSSTLQAEYARATAELDRRVAATFAQDKQHNDEAHARAANLGIDLTESDAQRERLEQERRDAIARGDKMAQRQADAEIAQNTYGVMQITGASKEELDEQQRTLTIRREALAEQSRLQAGIKADGKGLSESEAGATVRQSEAEITAGANIRTERLGGTDTSEATRLQLETEIRRAVSEAPRDASPSAKIEAALTPEARDAARKAMQSVTVNVDGFSLDDAPQLAHHAETETPRVPGKPVPQMRGLV